MSKNKDKRVEEELIRVRDNEIFFKIPGKISGHVILDDGNPSDR